MQSMASEMNLSETVYLEYDEMDDESFKSGRCFKIRWFTPEKEVGVMT